MEKIIGPAGTGKTKAIIKQAHDVNGVILCRNPYAMENKIKAYGLGYVSCFSYVSYLKGEILTYNAPIFIDDLEEFVRCAVPKLEGYGLTIDGD